MNKESVNKKLVEFWDNAFLMSKEDREELDNLKEQDYKELAPSKKLYKGLQQGFRLWLRKRLGSNNSF